MLAGKVCGHHGLRRRRQGLRQAREGGRARHHHRIDPICARRRRWKARDDDARGRHLDGADIFITATATRTPSHRRPHGEDEGKAIVGNIGHFDNEVDAAGLAATERINIKPTMTTVRVP